MKITWVYKFFLIWTVIFTGVLALSIPLDSLTGIFGFLMISLILSMVFTLWCRSVMLLWNGGYRGAAIFYSVFGLYLLIGFGTKYLLAHIWPDTPC